MQQPSPSQWAAVRACDEHVLVEAGAGTGKTSTVVARILFLLGAEIRGERYPAPVTLADIVAITFTRQAAADLKRDLRRALRTLGRRADAYAVDQARIGTIHGFCSDLVSEHALRTGRAPVTGVLEEGEALAWAEESVRDELLAALETRAVPGLDQLLEGRDVGTIEGWTQRLMQSDRLAGFGAAEHSGEERALLELATRARARLEARLEAQGTIDYDRMIAWTRDLLREHRGVRALMQRRVHTLIIDEFQDTDPVQREIAYLLAEPESGRRDTPRLMLVGDPKQSIYAFRGADVTVWSGVRRDFEERGQGRVLRLEDNFRSVPSILSLVEASAGRWLNTPVAGAALADYEVAFHPVAPNRPEPDTPAVELLLVPAGENGKALNAEDRRALEAHGIATRLNELHAAGTPWRDMALLLRRWTSLETYAGTLRAAGIPVYALRDDDFLETREVLDLVVALRAIRDPRDDLAVFGFLRSPFVCLRDDTLLAIAAGTPRPFALRLDPTALPESERIAEGIELLRELAALRDRVRAAELLDELLRRTGYLAHLALGGDAGAQAALNVRRFLQMVDGMEESGVGMVLRGIAERRARGDRVPQARLHGEQDDVVLITSVHMAKGLDWPVVVVGDLAAGENSDREKLLVGRQYIRIGEPDTKPEEQPERWQELRNLLQLESRAEEKRVTYVAITRPKDRLILAGIPRGGVRGSCVAGDLLQLLPGLETAGDGDTIPFAGQDGTPRRALVRIAAEPAAGGDGASDVARDDAAVLARLPLPPAPVATPLGLARHSATELLAFGRCERRHAFKYVLGIREPKPDAEVRPKPAEMTIDAIARGQIVHEVLERYAEEAAELDRLLEDAIGRWDEDAPPPETMLGRQYRTELAEEIERVLALPAYAGVAGAPGARRELEFLQVLADGNAMQGAIDLAAPRDGALTLIDVKTSRIEAAQAAKKAAEYTPQRDVYVAAAAALGPLPVREFGFVFSRPGTTIASAIDPETVAAAGERVRATLRRMAGVPFALASSPRECFLCGYRRARLCPGAVGAAPEPDAASGASE